MGKGKGFDRASLVLDSGNTDLAIQARQLESLVKELAHRLSHQLPVGAYLITEKFYSEFQVMEVEWEAKRGLIRKRLKSPVLAVRTYKPQEEWCLCYDPRRPEKIKGKVYQPGRIISVKDLRAKQWKPQIAGQDGFVYLTNNLASSLPELKKQIDQQAEKLNQQIETILPASF